ncbi:MAG: AbrB/MazE/SpoVT family DNA-binding domain-containing protein [Mariprofundaceae bacterium]|nr:AbrB/MazE/SpoVT family DNA-binding domain-containing protein [Mariprofundaceae bacterium]
MSRVALRKVGSSLVTTIPADVVQELHLDEGQQLEITKENGRIVMMPLDAKMEQARTSHDKIIKKYRAAFQKLADV